MAFAGILRTRLLPPRLPPGVVPRPELALALADETDGRFVAVVAGAGYGKTTLLRLGLETSSTPWAWCSCDARLLDARILLAHLAAGIAQAFPGFDATLSLSGSAEDQIDEFCNAIAETVPESFVIALDDVHLLPDDAAASLGPLVERLPPAVRLVMSGRAPLPIAMGRLRAGSVVELDERRLAFSVEETVDLVRSMGVVLDESGVAALHERAEGWPAGLILAAQSSAVPTSTPLTSAEFDYLAEEVMAEQPMDVQQFVRDTAILGRFSPDLAAAVTGRSDAADLVRRLSDAHLFTIALDDNGEWYRYHHLFQEFLRRKLDEAGSGYVMELHRRAATWWLAEGEPTEAVPHLLAVDDHDRAVEALEPVAEGLALSPQAEALAGWLAALPRQLWSSRPGLLLAEAALLFASARHEAAFADSERAIGQLVDAGDHERAAAALFRLQQAMLTAGTAPERRIEAGRRWRGRIASTSRLLPAARILLASGLAYGRRFHEAEEELTAALALPSAAGSLVLPLYASVVRSFYIGFWGDDPYGSLRCLQDAQRALEAHQDDDELGFLPFAEMLRCYLLNELGLCEEALAGARRLQEELDRRGLGRAIARSRVWVDATAFAALGRWEELRGVLAKPPVVSGGSAPTSYAYRYRAPRALLAAHDGDVDEVREQIAVADDEMRAFGAAFDDASFRCSFALAAAMSSLDDIAREQSREALAAAGAVGSVWSRACASLVAAHCELAEPSASDDFLAEALRLTAQFSLDTLWNRRYRMLAPQLLAAAISRSLGPKGEAERLLAACGAEAFGEALDSSAGASTEVRVRLAAVAGSLPDIDLGILDRLLRDRDPGVREASRQTWSRLKSRPRAEIGLITLGTLVVVRDGVPVPGVAFARQKARALLAALVAAGAPVHRDVLCERLWPDLSPDRAAAALRSTLHDLRRAIAPELESGDPSSPILTDGDTVRLALGERDSWDGGEILAVASSLMGPPPAVENLARAERLYGGPFLAEWPFEDWAMPRRVEIDEAFKAVVARFADELVVAGKPAQAIARFRRLLEMEPERESWHRDLMRAHAVAGERALALRQYHACRTVLRREQGIEPDLATQDLYRALLREAGTDL